MSDYSFDSDAGYSVRVNGRFYKKRVGKPGPVVIDTFVFGHNCFLDMPREEKAQRDLLVIGQEGEEITFDTIDNAIKEYNARPDVQDAFYEHGRSYFYEGLKYLGKGRWCIYWGS